MEHTNDERTDAQIREAQAQATQDLLHPDAPDQRRIYHAIDEEGITLCELRLGPGRLDKASERPWREVYTDTATTCTCRACRKVLNPRLVAALAAYHEHDRAFDHKIETILRGGKPS